MSLQLSHPDATGGPSTPIIIEIAGLQKWFSGFQVLKNINLAVRAGERIVICGPSGSGKSTLIRCINSLEQYQQGKLVVDGIDLAADQKYRRRPRGSRHGVPAVQSVSTPDGA